MDDRTLEALSTVDHRLYRELEAFAARLMGGRSGLRPTLNGMSPGDIVSHALMRVAQGLRRWKGRQPFGKWLYSVVSSTVSNQREKSRSRPTVALFEEPGGPSHRPESLLQESEERRAVIEKLMSAGVPSRLTEVMLDNPDIGNLEASSLSGLSRSEVENYRRLMRRQLKGDWERRNGAS